MISRYLYYQLSLFLFLPVGANCQQMIKYFFDEAAGYYTKIEFSDTSTGAVISSFDIRSNSPYENLNWQVTGLNTEGGSEYQLQKGDKTDVFKQIQQPYYTSDHDISRVSSLVTVYPGNTYAGIAYGLVGLNAIGEPVAWQSTLEVLNNRGETVFLSKDIPTEVKFPLVTDDGRFISFSYGGEINDSGDTLFHEGFTVLDMLSGSPLYQYKVKEKETLKIPFLEDQKLFLLSKTGTNPDSEWTYRVLHFSQNKVYKKTFSWYELNRIKEIRSDGFLLLSVDGENTEFLFFEGGFEASNIH